MIKFKFKPLNISGSKRYKSVLCSNEIRKRFVDYFVKENGHKFIKSSPVVPYNDPTIAFVNAGMCQVRIFKKFYAKVGLYTYNAFLSLRVCYLDKEL